MEPLTLAPRCNEKCVVISSLDEMTSLETGWNELWLRAKGSYFQSYSLCFHSWKDIAQPDGRTLFCIAMWQENKLVLVWPLVRSLRFPSRVIKPLGPTGAETSAILADPDSDVKRNVALAWQILVERCKCDIVHLPFVKIGSSLDEVTPKTSGAVVDFDAGPYAVLQDQQDWATYCKVIGAQSWQQVKRKRKRLSELGGFEIVSIDPVEEPERSAKLIDWMLEQKQKWGKRTHKEGPWISSPRYKAFLVHNITDPSNVQKFAIYAILIDREPIAVKLVAFCRGHLDYVIGGYHADAKYAKYSPGLVLDEDWMKVAFDQRLDVDFGAGQEPYKLLWSRGNKHEMANYRIPITFQGATLLAVWRQWRMFRDRLEKRRAG